MDTKSPLTALGIEKLLDPADVELEDEPLPPPEDELLLEVEATTTPSIVTLDSEYVSPP